MKRFHKRADAMFLGRARKLTKASVVGNQIESNLIARYS